MVLAKAAVMGVVEGLTEFLPISSTGHLILAASLLDFTGNAVKVFEVAIQTGAMFAVIWQYRERLARTFGGLLGDPIHTFAYLAFVLGSCALFSKTWIDVSGQSPKDMARMARDNQVHYGICFCQF